MSRVYTKKGSQVEYQEILSRTFYNEGDLENTVLTHLQTIFKDFTVIPFKVRIEDQLNSRNKIADLAIIKKDYTEWFIVEVELKGHSFSHVEEQIESFYNGKYTDHHAEYMESKNTSEFDLSSLKKMVSTYPPKLLVIADKIKPDWENSLEQYNCNICAFQIFLDVDGSDAYRLKGPYPTAFTDYCLASIKFGVMTAVELLGERGKDFCTTVGIENGDSVIVEFAGYDAKWKVNYDGSDIFLDCEDGYFPLDTSTNRYMLTYNSTNQEFKFKKA